jgi:hypothetical protein
MQLNFEAGLNLKLVRLTGPVFQTGILYLLPQHPSLHSRALSIGLSRMKLDQLDN